MTHRYDSIHEEREVNQFSLATFAHDAYNRFDLAADQAISQLKLENEKTAQDYDEFEKIKENDPARWEELQEIADHSDINLDGQVDGYMIDIIYRTEEMVALMEMKVIYAYKHLEINIKKLIAAAYPGTETRDFYRWSNLVTFLKSKMIHPEGLNGYPEIMELKQVNNKAKHTDNLQWDLQHIPEFRGEYAISYENMEKFYNRVKKAPDIFLKALGTAIYNEIYKFDDNKLGQLAQSIALRMDEQTAKKFLDAISALYG